MAFGTTTRGVHVITDPEVTGLVNSLLDHALAEINDDIEGITGALLFKGDITASNDFPTLVAVTNGWTYLIKADVTDNDPTKTNTGQSFLAYDEVAWNGGNWTVLGNENIWTKSGTVISPVNAGDVLNIGSGDFQKGGAALRNVTEALTNKTINADNNTISDLEIDNFKTGVIETSLTDDDTKLATSGAIVDYAEPVFSKNTAFNKNFGSLSGDVCEGDDARLSDSRTCDNTFDNATTAKNNLGLGTGDSPTFTGLTLSGLSDGIVKSSTGVLSGGNSVTLTSEVSGILPIANGGTNSSTALGNNKVMISSGGAIIESATITTTELGLLNGIVSVTTGTSNNDKFVTQGYVDDQISGSDDWDEVMHNGNIFTVLDTENISATINQNDVTNNPAALIITNTGTGNDITLPNSAYIKNGAAVFGQLTIDNLGLDANTISSSSGDILLSPTSNNVTIGTGAVGVDYTLTFDGETNDGVITWQEDEDTFDFSCNVKISNGALGISDDDIKLDYTDTLLRANKASGTNTLSSTVWEGTGSSTTRTFWQSITASTDLNLSAMAFYTFLSGNSNTIEVYEGEGDGGTLLASGTTPTAGASWKIATLNKRVFIASGSKFTMKVINAASARRGPGYAGGRPDTGPGDSDYNFRAYTDDGVDLLKIDTANDKVVIDTTELSTGTSINEFSIDGTLADNSDDAVPTEKAVKTYADNIDKLVSVPSSASDTGSLGNWSYGSGYLYKCVATDTWVRWAVATTW